MDSFFQGLIDDLKKDFKFGWQFTTSAVSLATNLFKSKKDITAIDEDIEILQTVVDARKITIAEKIANAKSEINRLKKD